MPDRACSSLPRPVSAQCDTNACEPKDWGKTCERGDTKPECAGCSWCQGPPSPPAPPIAPNGCKWTYEGCYEEQWPSGRPVPHCCVLATDGCYLRTGRRYAMCKPLPPPGTDCVSDEMWTCPDEWALKPPTPPAPPVLPTSPSPPPPPACAERYQECTLSRCCATEGFICLKRRDRWFAQCRYARDAFPLYATGICRPTDMWDCPGWWQSPPPPPSPPLPPPPPRPEVPLMECAYPWGACWGFDSPPPTPPPSPSRMHPATASRPHHTPGAPERSLYPPRMPAPWCVSVGTI